MAGKIAVPPMNVPSAARLWNELAGGGWADVAERDLALGLETAWPGTRAAVQAARAAHVRAAAWAVSAAGGCEAVVFGASGLPAPGLPHLEASAIAPGARFVYADPDPEAVLVTTEALAGSRARAVRGSVLNPGGLLDACGTGDMPVMMQVQMTAHFWPGTATAEVFGAHAKALPPGSVLFLSLLCIAPDIRGRRLAEFLAGAVEGAVFSHSMRDVRDWLEGAGLEVLGRGPAAARGRPHQRQAGPGSGPPPARAVVAAGRKR